MHKGFPSLLGTRRGASTCAAATCPKVRGATGRSSSFVAYHSGYFPGEGNDEFLGVVRSMKRKHRKRVYAELGSCFATAFLESPEAAAHLVGSLLKTLGSKHIVWGTDSIWWGSPQWQIDAFKALVIPEKMQRQFGYPALTEKRKAQHPRPERSRSSTASTRSRFAARSRRTPLARLQAEHGGPRATRSHRIYGPRTREAYEALLAHAAFRKGSGLEL